MGVRDGYPTVIECLDYLKDNGIREWMLTESFNSINQARAIVGDSDPETKFFINWFPVQQWWVQVGVTALITDEMGGSIWNNISVSHSPANLVQFRACFTGIDESANAAWGWSRLDFTDSNSAFVASLGQENVRWACSRLLYPLVEDDFARVAACFDGHRWKGTRVDVDQQHAWPRTEYVPASTAPAEALQADPGVQQLSTTQAKLPPRIRRAFKQELMTRVKLHAMGLPSYFAWTLQETGYEGPAVTPWYPRILEYSSKDEIEAWRSNLEGSSPVFQELSFPTRSEWGAPEVDFRASPFVSMSAWAMCREYFDLGADLEPRDKIFHGDTAHPDPTQLTAYQLMQLLQSGHLRPEKFWSLLDPTLSAEAVAGYLPEPSNDDLLRMVKERMLDGTVALAQIQGISREAAALLRPAKGKPARLRGE